MFERTDKSVVVRSRLESDSIDRVDEKSSGFHLRSNRDSGKESCEFMELSLFPAICRMVMTLSTLNLNPKKDP